ncbi:YybH family protein [Tellurirhabdus rosea]|uniref:YybH family protein n=1 Tax=Tellurirhabdus rosea TaxID=2674997 RepID=UPI00225215BC|nr:nuclear transport factor 2 family protein [Tellurirhabdus rosea]
MKHLILLLLSFPALAQKPVEAVTQAERAFAQMALDKGAKAAFLAYMADSAIMYVNGKPVLARPLYENRPDNPAKLIWGPAFVRVTAVGDMGISTGPWTIEAEGRRVAFGSFFTVWERQADGEYKFATDVGVSHPQPEGPIPPKTALYMWLQKGTRRITPSQLMELDAAFGRTIEKKGAEKTYNAVLTQTRFLREGKAPGYLTGAMVKTEAYRFTPQGGRVAAGGGMGFVYGTYTGAQNGSYLRVWTQEGKEDWKLAGEVLSPSRKD